MDATTKTNYECERIGAIEMGIDGKDVYMNVRQPDDSIDAAVLTDHLLRTFGERCSYPGGRFMDSITILPMPYSDNTSVAILHYRYDN